MVILALDTSTRNCSLAVLRDAEVVAATGGVSEEPYASRVFADAAPDAGSGQRGTRAD